MKTPSHDLIKDYYKMVDRLEQEKRQNMSIVMGKLRDDWTVQVSRFGWKLKGNGNISETMLNTSTVSMDFVKDFHGEKVILTLSVNLSDTYNGHSYSQMKIKGSKPIPDKGWWKGGTGSPLEFSEDGTRDKFFLPTQLELIDRVYS